MKLKFLIGVLVFLIVLNLATIGSFVYFRWAGGEDDTAVRTPWGERDDSRRGPRGGQRSGARPRGGSGAPHRARLDPEEREQLARLLAEFREETKDLRLKIHELEDQALQLMQQDPVPRAVVDSLLGERSAIQLEISRRVTDKLIEAKAFLTEEQQRVFYDAILKARPGLLGGAHRLRGRR